MTRARAAAPLALAFWVVACAILAGCAAPGEPTARHPVVPATITDLSARQYGNAIVLAFTVPTRSMDREALAEHPTVEIYRAELAPGATPDKKTSWRLVYTVPSEQVDRYLKGERVEFRDTLAPDQFSLAANSSLAYKVRTSAVKARASKDSNLVLARIYPPPDAPEEVHVEVTETALVVRWAETPTSPGTAAHTYRVYRGVLESGEGNASQDVSQARFKVPLALVGTSASPPFRDTHFEFGTPYLYTVRRVTQFGPDLVESADSTPVGVTPRDVFPPAPPTGLESTVVPATGSTPAYVELSWAIGSEADLAGYFVYRSNSEDTLGERVSTEILPSPTFRDISVQPATRYFYRVTALDHAGNESPKSPAAVADVP